MRLRVVCASLAVLALAYPAAAQQRPLITQDPETIGAGRILIEGGIAYSAADRYPVSGLQGNLWQIPTVGVSIGISSIAEFQVDGGFFDQLTITGRSPAPLSNQLTVTGNTTHDIEDFVVAMKIRLLPEAPRHPALALRVATKLPDGSNERGVTLDTTDFYAALLGAKTVQSVRFVGNVGIGVLSAPSVIGGQNDVLTYGASFARAITDRVEIVGEINGRWSTRNGGPFPGTETRSVLDLGGRYTRGSLRLDAGVLFGLTTIDPTIGFTTGFTYVFNAFTLP